MKLLIADDSKVSRLMLLGITKHWGYEVIIVEDGEQAWNVMQQEDAPQLLLLDWEMPNMNGIEVCERVIAKDPDNPPYIILLTSRTSSEDIVKGLSKGAHDYLVKPFNSAELQVRLKVGRRMVQMQSKLANTLQELKALASHDALTGLLNRRCIMESLSVEIKRTERHKEMLCVSMCDIDYFKKVNDKYGHVVGDEVLKEVSKRMLSALRDHDLIGRYGGEEFLIVTPVDSIANAEVLNNRLSELVSFKPIEINDVSITVTVSIGITNYSVEHDQAELTNVITRADEALYQAKREGRNRIIVKKIACE